MCHVILTINRNNIMATPIQRINNLITALDAYQQINPLELINSTDALGNDLVNLPEDSVEKSAALAQIAERTNTLKQETLGLRQAFNRINASFNPELLRELGDAISIRERTIARVEARHFDLTTSCGKKALVLAGRFAQQAATVTFNAICGLVRQLRQPQHQE